MPPEFFHVTLAFLGSVPEERVSEVKAIARQVATEVALTSVEVCFDVIEYWKKAGVICATARADSRADGTRAGTLASALKSHLTAAGFAPDLKPFRGHVTLARKISRPVRQSDLSPVGWSFTDFALVESRTETRGAVYRVLESFPLSSLL
jgi:RNA 2',3'-cyclic 3'-phosphodiesterase